MVKVDSKLFKTKSIAKVMDHFLRIFMSEVIKITKIEVEVG